MSNTKQEATELTRHDPAKSQHKIQEAQSSADTTVRKPVAGPRVQLAAGAQAADEGHSSQHAGRETSDKSVHLNKFQSRIQQNFVADNSQVTENGPCNTDGLVFESGNIRSANQMEAESSAQDMELRKRGAAQPDQPASDRHDSIGHVGISVAPHQQRLVGQMAQYVVGTQAFVDDKQNVQSSMLAMKNASTETGPTMSQHEQYCTPQKLGLSSQRSIGASMGGVRQEGHQNMQEPESIYQNQSSQFPQAREQQHNSAAKLSADDLNFTNKLNQDLMCPQHQKIPQTDQVPAGQRKLSQNTHEESHNAYGYNIIFSESVNKFSEYQEYDPSDSHSNFPNNPTFAQINDLLEDNDDDVHVLNQQEPKMNLNYAAEDGGSVASGHIMRNSSKQPNGSNLLQPSLVQQQRGQSSCENTHPQLQYQSKTLGAGSGGGPLPKTAMIGDHNANNFATPTLAARNTTFSQSNLPPSLPGGNNNRHPSMDSRQPLQQTTQQIEPGAPHAMVTSDINLLMNQVHGFNHPGGIATSRKSVYSNQELQKNNFFKDEHYNQQQHANNQGSQNFVHRSEVDRQLSGIIDLKQLDEGHDANKAQASQGRSGAMNAQTSQQFESPMLPSMGRSLNLSALRTQDNCPVSSADHVPRERRLTAEEENLHGSEFSPPWQQHLKFPQSAERRQDGDRTSISHERPEQNQMYTVSQRQLSHQQDQELSQKHGQYQNNSFKGNFQYRGSSGLNQGAQHRQVVEPIEQKFPLTNRILVDDPHDQQELEFRISEIQQMNEFNKNKLDQQVLNRQQYSHRVGPIVNQSLPGAAGQQQSYQSLPMHEGAVNQGFTQAQQMMTLQENHARQHHNNDRHSLASQNDGQLGKSTSQNPMDRQQHQQDQMLFHGQHQGYNPNMFVNHQDVNGVQQQMLMQSQLCQNHQQMYDIHQSTFEEQQLLRQQSNMMHEHESLQAQMAHLKLDPQLNNQANAQARLLPQNQYSASSHAFQSQHMGGADGHNDRGYANAYPFFHAQAREPQMYFGGGGQDSNSLSANMHHMPAFYPQGHPLSHLPMQNQSNFGASSEQHQHEMMSFQSHQHLQNHQQNYNRPHQSMQSADIANFDLHIANPYGQHPQTPGQIAGAQAAMEALDSHHRQPTRPAQCHGGAQQQYLNAQQMGLATDFVVDDQGNSQEQYSKTNEEHYLDGGGLGGSASQQPSQVMNSSRSSHQAQNKQQSKTAQAVHELSASQKSSTGKGHLNSGSDSNQVSSSIQPNQFSQKKRGSVRADPSIGSRDNSKGKNKGVTSRGAASDDGQLVLSSQSQYDSQNSKDNTVFSSKAQKQLFQSSTKDVTATVSSQKNQSDGAKRKSLMAKGSSGGGLSTSANPNEVQKEIVDDLKNKKQSMSRVAAGKIKSHSNYYDAKSMNEKISQSKSYHEGSQYSSKNSVKSGGNETGGGGSANAHNHQNYDRLSQKAANILTTTTSNNMGRKQSYSQGGSQNRNVRSIQSMSLQVHTGHSNTGQHGSNQSYDEFISQIQHDIKMAKGDADKEFSVLDGNIMKLASKKVGSMFLQDYLKNADQQLINKIIDQVDGKLADLMVGKYGNFFCSKLIEYLQPHQRIHFLKQISGKKFVEISCDEKGTWALQNILHAAMKDEEYRIIEETIMRDDNISRLSKDKQGHHMINLIITSYPEAIREQIFDYICANFKELAQDQNGLCVMKKIIEYARNDVMKQRRIVENIIIDSLEYVQHEFGNFVVQEIINLYDFEMCRGIYDQMVGHFQRLSLNKFSSKLIETCIDRAPLELQDKIVKEFCSSPCLHKVVQGNFGNFVLQKSIEHYLKSRHNKLELIASIIKCLDEVSDYKVQEKWGDQLLVRYLNDLEALPGMHIIEVDSVSSSEQDFKAFMEQKRQVEDLLTQKMKEIHYQHQMQKQHIQNQMQGAKGAPYGGYHGARGGQSNAFMSKYHGHGHGGQGGGGHYINNKHHQKMNKYRGGNHGQGHQPHRNSMNAVNTDSSSFYDASNAGNMMYQPNQGKYDQFYNDQSLNNQNQVNNYGMMPQQFGGSNYAVHQQIGGVHGGQNDHFNYQRFGGSGYNQQQPFHPADMQGPGVSTMGRASTGSFNAGGYTAGGAGMYQGSVHKGFPNRGNDRNHRGGYFQQNQQQPFRGQPTNQSAQDFYQETQQPMHQVQGRNSNPQPALYQKRGKNQGFQFQKQASGNQAGPNQGNNNVQRGAASGIQSHGQQRKENFKKQVFKKSNIKFAIDQGQNQLQQPSHDAQAAVNNSAGVPNQSLAVSAKNSAPNLPPTDVNSTLQRNSLSNAVSQQQLEQNNVPTSLFNADPFGITPNGSSGGTTGRENESQLD